MKTLQMVSSFSLFFLLSCESTAQKQDYYLNWTVDMSKDSLFKQQAIDVWIKYLKTKDENSDPSYYWNDRDVKNYDTGADYYVRGVGNSYYHGKLYYRPTILNVEKIADSTFIIKTAFARADSNQFAKLAEIVDVMVIPESGTLRLKSMIDYNLKKNNYVTRTVGNITYRHRKDYTFNVQVAQKFDSLNNTLPKLFEVEGAIKFEYILCKDSRELDQLNGFDFSERILNPRNDGLASYAPIPRVYSENNTEYFPHELIHLYVRKKNGDRHNGFFDEGIASLLGDCGYKANIPFPQHLKRVANYVKSTPSYSFSDLKNLQIMDDVTHMEYFVGGLFCKVMYEKEGMQGIFKLLSTDPDVYITLEKVMNLKKENIDAFIKTELKKYE